LGCRCGGSEKAGIGSKATRIKSWRVWKKNEGKRAKERVQERPERKIEGVKELGR
jgi:hypothetical protein